MTTETDSTAPVRIAFMCVQNADRSQMATASLTVNGHGEISTTVSRS